MKNLLFAMLLCFMFAVSSNAIATPAGYDPPTEQSISNSVTIDLDAFSFTSNETNIEAPVPLELPEVFISAPSITVNQNAKNSSGEYYPPGNYSASIPAYPVTIRKAYTGIGSGGIGYWC